MHPRERAQGAVGALPETVAGALAYCTIIPAIVFLLVEPYSRNRFVRFHSFQSLELFLVGLILSLIPFLGHLFVFLVSMLVGLALFFVWLVLIVKALQGEMFKLPLIGDIAEKQAAAS